ncbi:MAG TPA: hypothetical protein VH088_04130 [Terriglobales bacterium]|jgi:hypothetical protein|nr:hypothetical protein [Terriglobales bacterium]
MNDRLMRFPALLAAILTLFVASTLAQSDAGSTSDIVDHRYYNLDSWMGAIGLPDDTFKTLVDADGTFSTEQGKTSLRQGIYPLAVYESPITIHSGLRGGTERVGQRMYSPRVPISIAHKRQGDVVIEETLFMAGPLDWSSTPTGAALKGKNSVPRPTQYLLMTEYTNNGSKPVEVTPVLDVMGPTPGPSLDDEKYFDLSPNTSCRISISIDGFRQWESSTTMYKPKLALKKLTIAPGGKAHWVLTINRNGYANSKPIEWDAALKIENDAIAYWQKSVVLPYDAIQVPDPEMQAIIETAVRETYQMRYVINDLPAFYLGARSYNEYWVLDGSVVDEALDVLGRNADAGGFADYMLLHQHPDGRVQALTLHWKETAIALVALYRHARMTQDKQWLRAHWPQFSRAVAAIEKFRHSGSSNDPSAPNYHLSPVGFGDGGVMVEAEFTNNHWMLAGMKAAVDASHWLGEDADAQTWGAEYSDFNSNFQKAIAREARTDTHGNRYIPAVMGGKPTGSTTGNEYTPTVVDDNDKESASGEWAFLLGVAPGHIFDKTDPLMLGTLKMMEAHEAPEQGGIVEGCGWSSFWTACSSFYARDLLWLGQGQKAAQLQYAIARHSSPGENFCEETPKPKPGQTVPFEKGCGGDMPDIFNVAEFIRLTGQLLAFDRGQELHLFEGLPPQWLKPGMITRLNGMGTIFGKLTLELKVSADGKSAMLKLAPLGDHSCQKIVLHLAGWASGDAVRELTPGQSHELKLSLLN